MYTEDPEEVLTPSHLSRVKPLNYLIRQFENRWKHKYITELREYRPCGKATLWQVRIGDV